MGSRVSTQNSTICEVKFTQICTYVDVGGHRNAGILIRDTK